MRKNRRLNFSYQMQAGYGLVLAFENAKNCDITRTAEEISFCPRIQKSQPMRVKNNPAIQKSWNPTPHLVLFHLSHFIAFNDVALFDV
ncbi:MAG: hypothetical protein CRN43_00870, partial [Candidatus Nephrothrix sp. EaCA]